MNRKILINNILDWCSDLPGKRSISSFISDTESINPHFLRLYMFHSIIHMLLYPCQILTLCCRKSTIPTNSCQLADSTGSTTSSFTCRRWLTSCLAGLWYCNIISLLCKYHYRFSIRISNWKDWLFYYRRYCWSFFFFKKIHYLNRYSLKSIHTYKLKFTFWLQSLPDKLASENTLSTSYLMLKNS